MKVVCANKISFCSKRQCCKYCEKRDTCSSACDKVKNMTTVKDLINCPMMTCITDNSVTLDEQTFDILSEEAKLYE